MVLLLFCYINKKTAQSRAPFGIPATCRRTFSFIDVPMERCRVRFDFRSRQGSKKLNDEKAAKAIGRCRESHQHDLYDSIEKGDYPRRNLDVRVMPQKNAAKSPLQPLC